MIVFLILFLDQCQKKSELQENYTDINNWRDSATLVLNDQYAQNAALETSKRSAFLQIEGLQGEKLALQNLVQRERNISAALRNKLRIQISSSTKDVNISYSKSDEVNRIVRTDGLLSDSDSLGWPLPTYTGTITEGQWYTARIRASSEDIAMELDMQATLSYTWQYKRTNGFFSVKEPIVEAKVDNPYVNFESLESWSEKPKPPRWSWGITGGIGMDISVRPIIGIIVGPSYRLRDF